MRGIFTFCLLFTVYFTVYAQSQGPRTSTTGAQTDRPNANQPWTTPENAMTDNGSFATTNLNGTGNGANTKSDYLQLSDFGFNTIAGLPDGYRVTGIAVTIKSNFTNAAGYFDIVNTNGLAAGNTQTFTTGTVTLGGATQTFGNTLTTTDIKDADFGLVIFFDKTANPASVSVDYASITVYYTNTAPTANSDNFNAPTASATITSTVLTNDTDPSNETLTAAVVDQPSTPGTFTFQSTGAFSYTPPVGFAGGPVTFTYTVTDNGTPALTSAKATVTLTYPDAALLPVDFISFNANKAETGVQLAWKVGNEVNVARYEVERSTDGANYKTIGSVTATQSSSYGFTDLKPLSGTSYYRVRNVDKDGQFKYTTVVKYSNGRAETQVKAFPTATRGMVTFQHPAVTGKAQITISTLEGRTIRSFTPAQGTISTPVDLSPYPSGTYLLHYGGENGRSEAFRIVKQ